MSKKYTLRLVLHDVTCNTESSEVGNDEIHLLGFGITKHGHRMTIPPFKVGSMSSGDVKDYQSSTSTSDTPSLGNNPGPNADGLLLASHEVKSDDLHAMFVIYMIEKDQGHTISDFNGVVKKIFWNCFDRTVSELRRYEFEDNAIAFQAFAENLHELDRRVHQAASESDGNPLTTSDDVFKPIMIRYANTAVDANNFVENEFRTGDFGEPLYFVGGKYQIRYNFHIHEERILETL
ncbi:MAG: hypothetical protein R2797_06295 [Gelidibacter sp.]